MSKTIDERWEEFYRHAMRPDVNKMGDCQDEFFRHLREAIQDEWRRCLSALMTLCFTGPANELAKLPPFPEAKPVCKRCGGRGITADEIGPEADMVACPVCRPEVYAPEKAAEPETFGPVEAFRLGLSGVKVRKDGWNNADFVRYNQETKHWENERGNETYITWHSDDTWARYREPEPVQPPQPVERCGNCFWLHEREEAFPVCRISFVLEKDPEILSVLKNDGCHHQPSEWRESQP